MLKELIILLNIFFLLITTIHCRVYYQDANKPLKICTVRKTFVLDVSSGDDRLAVMFNYTINNFKSFYPTFKNRDISFYSLADNVTYCMEDAGDANFWKGRRLQFRMYNDAMGPISETKVFDVRLYSIPVFITEQKDIEVKENEASEVACAAEGYPKLSVQLTSNLPEIKSASSTGSSQEAAGQNSSMETATVKADEFTLTRAYRGFVNCTADITLEDGDTADGNNAVPTVSFSREINVLYPPSITNQMAIAHTFLTDSVKIQLTVDGNPRAVFNCSLLNVAESRIITFEEDKATADQKYNVNIQFPSLQEKDIGNYSCVASNDLGQAETIIQLTLDPRNVSVVQKESTSKYCDYYDLILWVNSGSPLKTAQVKITSMSQGNESSREVSFDVEKEANGGDLVLGNPTSLRRVRLGLKDLPGGGVHTIFLQSLSNAYKSDSWVDAESGISVTVTTPECDGSNKFGEKKEEILNPTKDPLKETDGNMATGRMGMTLDYWVMFIGSLVWVALLY